MKIFRGQDNDIFIFEVHLPLQQIFRFFETPFLRFFALFVERFQRLRHFHRFIEVGRYQQVQAAVGLTQSSGGVQTRPHAETHGRGVDFPVDTDD